MKKSLLTMMMIAVLAVCGCTPEQEKKVDAALAKANLVAALTQASEPELDAFLSVLEKDIPGYKGIDENKVNKAVAAVGLLKKASDALNTGAKMAENVPQLNPYARFIDLGTGALSTLALAVMAFLKGRMTKKESAEALAAKDDDLVSLSNSLNDSLIQHDTLERATVAVLKAVDIHKDVGKDIVSATTLAGGDTAAAIKDLYQQHVAQ